MRRRRNLPELVIDGTTFSDLEGFWDACETNLGMTSCRGFNQFNDCLRGGMGTPERGFILRWVNSDLSAERLGWPATIRYWEDGVRTNASFQDELDAARRRKGNTLFDDLVETIRRHGPGGKERYDHVYLVLDSDIREGALRDEG